MTNDKTKTAEELRKQFEKETGESSNIASYTYWLEQKLLSTQEKMAVGMTEPELRIFANRVADFCKNNYCGEEYVQKFVTEYLASTGQQSENKTEQK